MIFKPQTINCAAFVKRELEFSWQYNNLQLIIKYIQTTNFFSKIFFFLLVNVGSSGNYTKTMPQTKH